MEGFFLTLHYDFLLPADCDLLFELQRFSAYGWWLAFFKNKTSAWKIVGYFQPFLSVNNCPC